MLIMELKNIINKCDNLKTETNILLSEINDINNTNYELLKAKKYYYYSKTYSNAKKKLKTIIEE